MADRQWGSRELIYGETLHDMINNIYILSCSSYLRLAGHNINSGHSCLYASITANDVTVFLRKPRVEKRGREI